MALDESRRSLLRAQDAETLAGLRSRGAPRDLRQALTWALEELAGPERDGVVFRRPDREPVPVAVLFRKAMAAGRWSSVARFLIAADGRAANQLRSAVERLFDASADAAAAGNAAVAAWDQSDDAGTREALLAAVVAGLLAELGWDGL